MFIKTEKINYRLSIDNVERILEEERLQQLIGHKMFEKERFKPNKGLPATHFWKLEEINEYISYLTENYQNITSSEIIGRTHEGRPIQAVKISQHGQVDGSRPIIFIDAGIHAREWITHMSAIYILHNLVERSHEHRDILTTVDFIVVPVVNPDGYEFSHTQFRLWRKNRRVPPNSECVGVDLNRNYGFKWQNKTDFCALTYPGPAAFSEPETQAIRKVFLQYRGHIKLYFSLHSYGNLVLYPYGYVTDRELRENVTNWQEHEKVGLLFSEAVYNRSNSNYTVKKLEGANGESIDYAASIGVNLALIIEITNGHGFILPIKQIHRARSEIFAGVVATARYVANNNWSLGVF